MVSHLKPFHKLFGRSTMKIITNQISAESSTCLIAISDEVRALLGVLRRDLAAVEEEADEAAAHEAEAADEVPAKGTLELRKPTAMYPTLILN